MKGFFLQTMATALFVVAGAVLALPVSAKIVHDGKASKVHHAVTVHVTIVRQKSGHYAFKPRSITITVGTVVTWMNLSGSGQTVTEVGDTWSSGTLPDRKTYRHRFDRPGTVYYTCAFHTYMQGVVIVKMAHAKNG